MGLIATRALGRLENLFSETRRTMAKAETAAQTAGEDVRPSVDELVERARALVPALRERAPLAEELRRLPDETAQDFKDAGIVRMGTPTKFGGYG
jgi:3-hydroxy-9,10-secoandrosta-1,3,5(10)-triene-9,17-dione monooxygenase